MTHKIIRADGVTELSPIKSFTIQQKVNSAEDLRPGCVSSAKIEVEVFGAESDAPDSGEALTAYEVDEESNETLLGTFYARPAVSSKTTYMFTAYDGMKKADTDFSQRLRAIQDSFPMTLGELVGEALDVAGLTLSGTFPMADMPVQQFLQDGLTCRDILSYAAEIACRFVRVDENGDVLFDWYKESSASGTDTASGTLVNFDNGGGNKPVVSLVAAIVPVQQGSGTPSPENPRIINGAGSLTLYVGPSQSQSEATVYYPEFGRTIYKGEMDVTNGIVTETYVRITLTGANVSAQGTASTGAKFVNCTITQPAVDNDTTGLCSRYEFTSSAANPGQTKVRVRTSRVVIYDDRFTSVQAAQTIMNEYPVQVMYKLATPNTYTVTPTVVRTLAGTNYIWTSRSGSIDVTYTTNETLRIYPTSGTSEDGTEIYVPYKQDGIEYGNETAEVDGCAVHPSDNSSEPVIYPPGGENTASGSPIIIQDGVEAEPVSMELALEYVSLGYVGAHIIVTRNNILNPDELAGTHSGLTFTQNTDGTFDINGTASGTTVSVDVSSMSIPKGVTSVVFSGNPEGSTGIGEEPNYYTELYFPMTETTVYARGTGDTVVPIPSGAVRIDVRFVATGSTAPVFSHATYAPMIRLNASDSSDFVPFGTDYGVSWLYTAEDVYGGTYNPLTGELVSMYDPFGNLLETPVTYTVGTMPIVMHSGTNIIYDQSYHGNNISLTYYSSSVPLGNAISIRDNILLAGASYSTMAAVARNVYAQISPVAQYRPASINLFPFENPFRIGEIANVTDAQGVSFVAPIMSLTVGPSAAVIESTGNEEYDLESSNVDKALQNITDNMVRINRLKVSWADIDEAVIRALQTNYLKVIGLLISGDYTSADALVSQMTDGIIQFFRGDDTNMYASIGLNQVDDTENTLHVSSTDDGDAVAVDFFTGTEYKAAYKADFTDPDNPVNEFTGTMTLNGEEITPGANALTLLWTNPSPTSAMEEDTTILSDGVLENYDIFLIKFKENTGSSSSTEVAQWFGKTASGSTSARWVSFTGGNMFFNNRYFTISNNGMAFQGGLRYTQGQSSAAPNDAYMVPLEVYGLKL